MNTEWPKVLERWVQIRLKADADGSIQHARDMLICKSLV
jgi:hypothetical protein